MANSTINVKVDMSGVASKIRKICTNKQLGMVMAEAGAEIMNNKYVPKRSTALRLSYVVKPFNITWNTPYAHRHWSGFGDGNRTTPGTRSHWEQPKDVAEFIEKRAQDWLNHQ